MRSTAESNDITIDKLPGLCFLGEDGLPIPRNAFNLMFHENLVANRYDKYNLKKAVNKNIKKYLSRDKGFILSSYRDNASLSNKINLLTDDIIAYQRKINEAVGFITQLADAANNVDTFDIISQIDKICSEGFYSYFKTENQCVNLITRPITLTEINKAAGINLSVPMGSYRVKLELRTLNLTVHSHKENLVRDNLPHPFISGGHICWGDHTKELIHMYEKFDIHGILKLLQALLTTYSHQNPYRSLNAFKEIYDDKQLRKRNKLKRQNERIQGDVQIWASVHSESLPNLERLARNLSESNTEVTDEIRF
jgi:hypothetical protein